MQGIFCTSWRSPSDSNALVVHVQAQHFKEHLAGMKDYSACGAGSWMRKYHQLAPKGPKARHFQCEISRTCAQRSLQAHQVHRDARDCRACECCLPVAERHAIGHGGKMPPRSTMQVMVDIGCNKGYMTAEMFSLFAPQLAEALSPQAVQKHVMQQDPPPPYTCGVCSDCLG